jgi:hypothetical protein
VELEDMILFIARREPGLKNFDLTPVKVFNAGTLREPLEDLDRIDYRPVFLGFT